jgi:hypothetical protein
MQTNSSSKDAQSTDVAHVSNTKNLVLSREWIRIHLTNISVPYVIYTIALLPQDTK